MEYKRPLTPKPEQKRVQGYRNFKMLSVTNSGSIDHDFVDRFVTPFDIDREFVNEVNLAMYFVPSGIRILLPAFGRFQVCGRRLLIIKSRS